MMARGGMETGSLGMVCGLITASWAGSNSKMGKSAFFISVFLLYFDNLSSIAEGWEGVNSLGDVENDV